MLKIYHMPPSRSERIVWLAEEMGLPYEVIPTPIFGERPEGFKDVSPLGQLPAIEDGAVRMIESVAIMQYLLARYGPSPLAVAPEEADFPAYLQYLEFGEAGLCAIGNAYVATRFRAPDDQKQNWTLDYVLSAMRKRLGMVEAYLEGRDYMAANRFTAADISVAWGIGIFKYLGVVEGHSPRLQAYHERVANRPAYLRASAKLD
ncbi:MAG: glutathione S-transferase family protein [Pseudomonadota bacterium]